MPPLIALTFAAAIIKPHPDSHAASILQKLIIFPLFIRLIFGYPLAYFRLRAFYGGLNGLGHEIKGGKVIDQCDEAVLLDYSWVLMGVLTSVGWLAAGGGFPWGPTKTTSRLS